MPSLPLYEAVFLNAPVGNCLLSPTADAIILSVNDAFVHASTRPREDLVGRRLFDVFPENPADPGDTGVSALRSSIAQAIATGKPQVMPAQRYPIRIVTTDGEVRFEERYWSAVNAPVFDKNGRLLCISHTTSDITDQIRAEMALRKSEARYRSLFESITEGFCIVEIIFDGHGAPIDYQFCETNPVFERQTGLQDAVGKRIRQLRPDYDRRWIGLFGEVARTGVPLRLREESKALQRWYDIHAYRVDEPRAHRVAVLFRDVTDEKRAEEELCHSEQQALEAARQAEAERNRLNAVLEATPVAIVVADATGGLVNANAANRLLWGHHPWSHSAGEYREWKGWWADGSERQGRRLAADEWTMSRVLRGEEAPRDLIEIETFDMPPVRRIIINSGAPIRDHDGRLAGGVVAQMDVTDRIAAEASLRETAARLRFTLESAGLGDWDVDLATGEVYHSLLHDRCFGYTEPVPDWSVEKFLQHVHPEDRHRVQAVIEDGAGRLKDWHYECRVIWPDGTLHWIAVHGSVRIADGKAARMQGIVSDITSRKQTEEKLRHASLHDPLTGLPNRTMLFEYATHMLSYNKRTNQHAAVLFLDLDRFKPINDTHGHEAGDAVLRAAATRLSRGLRAADVVIRLGGDEFVILLQDIRNPAFAAEVARHVIDRINEPYHIGDLALSVSASIGISIFPEDGTDIDTLVSHADMAMYQAKQSGRNNYQFFSPEFAAGTRQQLAIEQQLKAALRGETFYLCYQPVVDVASGEVVSVEALLRWRHADIGPDRFVPVAEATGMINPIGRWLLEEAARQHKTWLHHGLPAIPVAVNVSVVEFRDKDFVERFSRVTGEHGINANALQLELTETTMMDDIDHAVAVLTHLKRLGVKVLLDDFGTGHSSLAYLARLPLDKIKIDKSFVSRLENDVASQAVTDAMIAIGRTLNLEIVAEGIETARLLDYVSSHGCGQAQGFYLGRPMPGDAFEAWYREQKPSLPGARRSASGFH